MSADYHEHDADCEVVDGECVVCGVSHSDECPLCHQHAFHLEGCAEIYETPATRPNVDPWAA